MKLCGDKGEFSVILQADSRHWRWYIENPPKSGPALKPYGKALTRQGALYQAKRYARRYRRAKAERDSDRLIEQGTREKVCVR